MDTEQVNEILRLLKIIADSSTANKIAAISMIVSGIAVLSSIYFSHQTRVQYIESLSPMLSFELRYTVNHPYCSNFKPPFLAARF